MVLVLLLDIMPNVSSRYDGLGVGFAPYLQPPGPEVVRWTVGEPGFDTPSEIIDAAIFKKNKKGTGVIFDPNEIGLKRFGYNN